MSPTPSLIMGRTAAAFGLRLDRLIAGGSTAATVSGDALRGPALAFLALTASDPQPTPEDQHGQD